ncbi:hypothetical protein SAMN04487788_2308 [Microbacterium testaceum StLB037]|uniref:Uncharacterized protein n=2 Tax=Microbacterium testaceum TaxID=2033 RepID=A0A1H0Q921_MICTS|nr:hypothetical protein SAMN04487788_2308 [Microbacterium testaceum StLB037]
MNALENAITRVNGDGDYIARLLTEALLAERPISDEPPLSGAEADVLVASGAFTREELTDISDKVRRGSLPAVVANTLVAHVYSSMSNDDVRGFLDLKAAELDHAVETRKLHAVEVAGMRRFPMWQFSLSSPGKLLPHLPEIIELVGTMNWISLAGLMSTKQSEMESFGAQSPVEWFRQGGEIGALKAILVRKSRTQT